MYTAAFPSSKLCWACFWLCTGPVPCSQLPRTGPKRTNAATNKPLEHALCTSASQADAKKIWFPGRAVAYTPGFEPRTPAVMVKCVSSILCHQCDSTTGIRNHQFNMKRAVSLLYIVSVQNPSTSSRTGRRRGLHDTRQESQEHCDARVKCVSSMLLPLLNTPQLGHNAETPQRTNQPTNPD